ncbi:MAG: CDP-alcohol phosphatidyltransferase family protein [Methanocellales archaeon]|nr:CDP-alcohol phosphatidyltransferase family protein [Methanocellales archaeon]MDD3291865.1 CDP-alcohol phosphatidyltransferase family protein [Methanocellales archaeon]MDD5235508.1 CDP-alcohol phosphatidyltransferase family protein [Methanocellales archaeon]MDD5485127.1 CDP-alcohol phosphatidyltransferase family protein [Methanocellales archaeon]
MKNKKPSHLDMSQLKGAKFQDLHAPIVIKLHRIASTYVAERIAKYTEITPNQITLLSSLLILIAAYFIFVGKYPYLIFSSILIIFAFFFDSMDGSLARITGTASTYGKWVDMFLGLGPFALVILFYAAMYGLFRNTGNYLVWVYGPLGLIASLIIALIYNTFLRLHTNGLEEIEREKKKSSFLTNFYYTEYFVFHLLALACLFNRVNEYLIFCAVYGWIFLIAVFIKLTKKAHHLKRSE